MSKNLLSLFTALLLGTSLIAQDKAEIIVKISKDGTVVKDTTYSFDDLKMAKNAIQLIEVMTSDETHFAHADNIHLKMMEEGNYHHKKLIFINEDGEVTEIDGDGDKDWVTKDEDCAEKIFINEDDGKVKVIVKTIQSEHGDDNVKMKKEVFLVKEDLDGKKGTWTVEEREDGEVIVINEDGKKIKMIEKEILSDSNKDGNCLKWVSEGDDEVNVVVIKTTDEDDVNIEVEVKVHEEKSKKKNKEKK